MAGARDLLRASAGAARWSGLVGVALAVACGAPDRSPGAAASDVEAGATGTQVAFANHCSATGPDVHLVTPTEAPDWQTSDAAYCVVFENTSDDYDRFDPLGLEGPCGAGDSVAPWRSSRELYALVDGSGGETFTLHVATRIEETDDERCVGCYPEESGCAGTTSIRELSRDVSLTMPEDGGTRVVPLTEIEGLDYEGKVLSLELAIELLVGDSIVARDSLRPVWARCC